MNRIDADNLIERIGDESILDARSPSEYAAGHVVGAVSLPLFDDLERESIGKTYKQQSSAAALLEGLEFAGPKMRTLVESATELAPDKRAVLYCWRGGQRSSALAWLLDFSGFKIDVVEGGYKAYRHEVLQGINNPNYRFVVLGGRTGSGKTELLHELANQGEQVVDLEGLAHHKGSAFGGIGEEPQPTSEQFENTLFESMRTLDPAKKIWIENESRGIGHVFLPADFSQRLRTLPLINISVDRNQRVKRLVDLYALNKNELKTSFIKIAKKLGQNLNTALEALEKNDFESATEIALAYYDRTYQYSLDRATPEQMINVDFGSQNQTEIVRRLIELGDKIDARQLVFKLSTEQD